MTDEMPYPPPDSLSEPVFEPVSKRYRWWLTSSLMLALATMTLSVVIIIVTNAREKSREEEFSGTLTAVWQSVQSIPVTPEITLTPAPLITAGAFPFGVDHGGPVYSAAESCTAQVLTGKIIDVTGQAADEYSVRVWGDFLRTRSLFTGELANEAPGVWSLVLTDAANRRLWVQVMQEERTLSAPVEVVFNASDCARSHAEIIFREVAAGG